MNVLFVNVPFSAVRPAIGVSLLKAHLAAMGVSSRVEYLNMRFAAQVGAADYGYVADAAPSQSLAGDWVFSRCAFGARDDADAAYLEMFPTRFARFSATDEAAGALVRCRDVSERFLDECMDAIDWEAYDVIGFTSTFTQHVASLALARRIKERFPERLIVFGGGNCEAEMGLQLHRSFPFVDFVCGGEADLSFPRLIRALMEGGDAGTIPGVISRVGGRSQYVSLAPDRVQDLDTLPYPDYADYFEQLKRIFPGREAPFGVPMETSRGCWWGEKHHCTFCGLNGTSMAFRSKRAERVLAEIAELSRRYESRFINVVDNILDMRYFGDVIPELGRRRLTLNLFYEVKANLTKNQLRALSAAGVRTIQPGIESFSSNVLRIMRKGTTAVQNVQLLKWCRELGVKAYWNLLYGFPGENDDDYDETARIIGAIRHLQPPVGFGAIRLDRFSPNFEDAAQLGFCNVRPDRSYRYIYDLPDDALFGLAYYFEHDYVVERDPNDYVDHAFQAFRRWQREPPSRGLVYADHGHALAIWDLRSGARKTLTILKGFEREAYLFCDQNRSLQQIVAHLAEHGFAGVPVEHALEELAAAGLVMHLDGRYLSLATPAAATSERAEDVERAFA